MRKLKVFSAFLFLLGSVPLISFADEIFLKNGEVIQCNILEENTEKGTVKVDVVLDGQLAGMQMVFNDSEIKELKRDEKYKDVVKKEPDVGEKQAIQTHLDRLDAKASAVDTSLKERYSFEVQRAKEMEAADARERERQQLLQHEKEMEQLKAEEQRELLKAAAARGVRPNVYIIDSK